MTKPPCQRGRCGCPGVLVLRLFSALGEAVAGVPVGQDWRCGEVKTGHDDENEKAASNTVKFLGKAFNKT